MPDSSLFLLLAILAAAAAAISAGGDSAQQELEIEAMMEALRGQGSSLFTNAISTSDLKYEILSSPSSRSSSASFTIFAPADALLYALDMVADADTYVRTLRYHVTPNHRRSFSDLRALPTPFLDTLLPHHSLLLANTATLPYNSSSSDAAAALADALMVDGVRVSAPDLFLGPTFAVHGIDGILLTGLSKYQDLDSEMDSDGLGISFLPPEMEIPTPPLPSPSPSDGLGFPFLPPDNSPLPPPSDGLGMPFLPQEITAPSPPPIADLLNTNYPAIPPPSSAESPTIGTRESWNSNNQDEKKAGHGKRRKRKHKKKKKHGHRRHHRDEHQLDL